MTCCILRNICENQHGLYEDEWLVRSPTTSIDPEDSSTTPSSSSSASNTLGQDGTAIRDAHGFGATALVNGYAVVE